MVCRNDPASSYSLTSGMFGEYNNSDTLSLHIFYFKFGDDTFFVSLRVPVLLRRLYVDGRPIPGPSWPQGSPIRQGRGTVSVGVDRTSIITGCPCQTSSEGKCDLHDLRHQCTTVVTSFYQDRYSSGGYRRSVKDSPPYSRYESDTWIRRLLPFRKFSLWRKSS